MQITQDLFTELPAHPFWDYSLYLYKKTEVKNACLILQDKHQLNVNIILLICWLAQSHRGRLSKDALRQLLAESYDWQSQITEKLRDIRRLLDANNKTTWAKSLRSDILEEELVAEHIEQLIYTDILANKAIQPATPLKQAEDAAASLRHYCDLQDVVWSKKLSKHMQVIVLAAFPKLTTKQLERLCLSS